MAETNRNRLPFHHLHGLSPADNKKLSGLFKGMKSVIDADVPGSKSIDMFVPGMMSDRTILRVPMTRTHALSQLDVFFRDPPVGVTENSCANVRVSDPYGASALLPLKNSGIREYHWSLGDFLVSSGYTWLGGVVQTVNGTTSYQSWPPGWIGDDLAGATLFVPTADLSIEGMTIPPFIGAVPNPYVANDFVRVGIAAGSPGDPTRMGGDVWTNTVWVKDSAGRDAYIDIPFDQIPNNPFPTDPYLQGPDYGTHYTRMTLPFANPPVKLRPDTRYWFVCLRNFLKGGVTGRHNAGCRSQYYDWRGTPQGAQPGGYGNLRGMQYPSSDLRQLYPWYTRPVGGGVEQYFFTPHNSGGYWFSIPPPSMHYWHDFRLHASITGLTVRGYVTFEIVMTGAPGNPGSDAMISALL